MIVPKVFGQAESLLILDNARLSEKIGQTIGFVAPTSRWETLSTNPIAWSQPKNFQTVD